MTVCSRGGIYAVVVFVRGLVLVVLLLLVLWYLRTHKRYKCWKPHRRRANAAKNELRQAIAASSGLDCIRKSALCSMNEGALRIMIIIAVSINITCNRNPKCRRLEQRQAQGQCNVHNGTPDHKITNVKRGR